MGWWKDLQDTLHPPPRRPARRPPGHTPLLGSTASSSRNSSDLEGPPPWSAPSEKPRRWRTAPSSLRNILLGAIAAMAAFTLLFAALCISGITYSPTRILLDAQARTIAANSKTVAWRRFPLLNGYYKGLFTLVEEASNVPEYPPGIALAQAADARIKRPDAIKGDGQRAKARAWNPYPEYAGEEYRKTWEGQWRECSFDEEPAAAGNRTRGRPEVRVFDGTPEGMPRPVFGGHGVLGINDDVCFDRYGRLGPYGYGYSAAEGGLGEADNDGGEDEMHIETGWGLGNTPFRKIDWRGVDWGRLQKQCLELNKDRFDAPVEHEDTLFPELGETTPARRKPRGMPGGSHHISRKTHPRTAVLLRTWTGYTYTPSDLASLRSLVSELSILSGSEYTVHLLVHVTDPNIPIWADRRVYHQTLQENVPAEFWGIAELWNEAMVRTVYHKLQPSNFRELPLHGVYRSTFMPVQWFASRHPEYEHFWNWEMDVRYTGHYYHLLTALDSWANKQPRKNLWERNERFYVPEVHGSWDDFSRMVDAATDTRSSIWGPVPVAGVAISPEDPSPPVATPEEDTDSTWGVGEAADLITLNPIFDPEGTSWLLSYDTTGYGPAAPLPRRAAIVTTTRLSRRLLSRMHTENAVTGHTMFSEMWPASCALHHGLKAVFAPHPVYVDRRWPTSYLERTFNNGVNGSAGGRAQSVFGEREHNFKGSTWYYNADFPVGLWRRWVGGEERAGGEGGEAYDRRLGRMCLKGVLLHPVKGEWEGGGFI